MLIEEEKVEVLSRVDDGKKGGKSGAGGKEVSGPNTVSEPGRDPCKGILIPKLAEEPIL